MSDPIKHECGIALIRLLKPLGYYHEKYGTPLWGFQKLFLLMEKQHNRGQDGVGIGCTKLGMPLGRPYMFRERSTASDSLSRVFNAQLDHYHQLVGRGLVQPEVGEGVKEHFDYAGELLMGHLRYGTSGSFAVNSCHPYLRRSNWPTKTLMVAGNFNMTNASELNQLLIQRGQHPVFDTDTQTVLEEIGYHLDQEHDRIYHEARDAGVEGPDIPERISGLLDPAMLVREAAKVWDGGYTIAGMVGNGDAFVFRDPSGIRPCSYIANDEVLAFASERVPLMTVFDVPAEEVQELPAGHVASIKQSGAFSVTRYAPEREVRPCSFERIYFSRGNDPDIYHERKAMGEALVPQVLEAVGGDLTRTVVSYVPNTAEIAYHGLMIGLRRHRRHEVRDAILKASQNGGLSPEQIDDLILHNWPRGEKIAHKDIKLRTFISQEAGREQLVSHVYDITYGEIERGDNLVIIDDSIVRGTTLKTSILKILTRTQPKKIIVASTAPQIRYPDCYGIDMAEIGKFIAFEAAVSLIKEHGLHHLIGEVHDACRAELEKPRHEMRNQVQRIYEPFTDVQISRKIAELLYPTDTGGWKGEVDVIFLGVDELHKAIPKHQGDWYFTGNYPTPGGYEFVNRAFIAYCEKRSGRVYDLV